jgi:hypothetical protein
MSTGAKLTKNINTSKKGSCLFSRFLLDSILPPLREMQELPVLLAQG